MSYNILNQADARTILHARRQLAARVGATGRVRQATCTLLRSAALPPVLDPIYAVLELWDETARLSAAAAPGGRDKVELLVASETRVMRRPTLIGIPAPAVSL
jgi:hypothetical protein